MKAYLELKDLEDHGVGRGLWEIPVNEEHLEKRESQVFKAQKETLVE